ncbi:peroxisomal membrane protein 4 [Rhodotorula toruloides]|uniref:Peroxisomal membrane protein 4 n=1 Tax=Rhodotorula toruloides TaxID=5286 RepID=A0A511KFP6_RHOTO|nr:peroxisomal membrane protein 4 [Rhodotorula toruloides]
MDTNGEQDNSPARPTNSNSPRRTPRFDLAPLSSLSDTDTAPSSPEPLATPTLAESYGQLKKNLSFKSLRDLEMRELKGHLYRRGNPSDGTRYRPKNSDEVFAHALKGGLRSFVLGTSLRAAVNLVITLLRLTRKKGLPPAVIIHAVFGPDVARFGGMLGLFSFLYKWTLHTLRLYNPGRLGPGQSERWHAAIAGLVSGASVWAEKPSRRVTIGQQMFVRGLQGHYNLLKSQGRIRVKNVSVIVFGLSCAQIMYSWLMAPEALPPGYRRWITQASRVSEPCLPVNLSAYRSGTFDPSVARKTLTWGRGATPKNRVLIELYAKNAEMGDFGPPFAPCAVVHPWADTCTWNGVDRWHQVFRWIAPVYAGLHFIPPILLRRKAWMRDPSTYLLRSLIGTFRSCSFLATFVALFQGLVCLQRHFYNRYHGVVPEWLEKIVMHKSYYWFSGFATCLPLFIEEQKRRRELAMYVLPRGLESMWSILRRRKWVPFVPGGEVLLTCVGLSMVMQSYQHSPENLSGLVRSMLWQIIGPA